MNDVKEEFSEILHNFSNLRLSTTSFFSRSGSIASQEDGTNANPIHQGSEVQFHDLMTSASCVEIKVAEQELAKQEARDMLHPRILKVGADLPSLQSAMLQVELIPADRLQMLLDHYESQWQDHLEQSSCKMKDYTGMSKTQLLQADLMKDHLKEPLTTGPEINFPKEKAIKETVQNHGEQSRRRAIKADEVELACDRTLKLAAQNECSSMPISLSSIALEPTACDDLKDLLYVEDQWGQTPKQRVLMSWAVFTLGISHRLSSTPASIIAVGDLADLKRVQHQNQRLDLQEAISFERERWRMVSSRRLQVEEEIARVQQDLSGLEKRVQS